MPQQTDRQRITAGQRVAESKAAFAKRLRREMTPQERVIWARVRDRRLHGWKFRRQQVIDGFVADFFCAAAGIVLELDGAVHEQQQDYDAHRDRAFAARHLLVIRITNDRIEQELERVLAEIAEACQQRIDNKTSPPGPLSVPEGVFKRVTWRVCSPNMANDRRNLTGTSAS